MRIVTSQTELAPQDATCFGCAAGRLQAKEPPAVATALCWTDLCRHHCQAEMDWMQRSFVTHGCAAHAAPQHICRLNGCCCCWCPLCLVRMHASQRLQRADRGYDSTWGADGQSPVLHGMPGRLQEPQVTSSSSSSSLSFAGACAGACWTHLLALSMGMLEYNTGSATGEQDTLPAE